MLDHLVKRPHDLVFPDGAELRIVAAADGIRIRTVLFRPKPVPSGPQAHPEARRADAGTIFVLPGRAEFIEKYGEVFARLIARGHAVAALDWRGQGGSQRQLADPCKGHVEDFADYLFDLDALVAEARRAHMPEPFALLAHSTGGAIALMALARGAAPFLRAVLTAPLVRINGFAGSLATRILARALAGLGFSGAYVPGGSARAVFDQPFENNPLTSDARRFAASAAWLAAEPRLAIGDPTIGWVDAAFSALARFHEADFARANRTPILMLIAGNDRVVDSEASAALAYRLRGASAIHLKGARHEILMESDAIQAAFWDAFDAFMALAPAAGPPGDGAGPSAPAA